ncbi:MAG: hypothetical protein DMF70_06920 [Acidobacteria bacterium]|nr:MAG: hypothetical protein DMF70_06920 [Acidobacteriota bacterium]
MPRTIKLVTIAAMLAVFAAPALAQSKECNDEFKSATYQKWYDNRKDHQDVAYEAAKEYLATCPDDDSPYKTALKKFKDAYDAITAAATTAKQFDDAVKNGKYAEQVRLGKLLLASDPDNVNNVKIYIILGVAGLNDPSLLSDSAQYATKAIELIEGGKPFAPLFDGSRDKALAQLNYVIAKTTAKNDPTAAIPYFFKAAKFESDRKKDPQLYLDLAAAYNNGPRAKLTEEYKAKYTVESPESKLALANINQFIDRQIDAMARAAALASNAADKKTIMDALTELYKDRYSKSDGLNELVAGILQKPLPEFPTPLTSLPTTPVSTPASSGLPSGTNGTTSSKTSTNVQSTNGQNKTGATGATGAQNSNKTTSGPKPSPSPTPGVKPKPRRANHRRG